MKHLSCLIPLVVLLCHCAAPKKSAGEKDGSPTATESKSQSDGGGANDEPPAIDVGFLLSMTYAEAAAITPSKLELPNARIAADTIDVLKADPEGKPLRVRAKGRVFVEVDFPDSDQARALSQEAYIDNDEVILRGRPVLQRGGATLEGITDQTVFFLFGNQVRAIGTHRRTNAQSLMNDMPLGLPSWQDGPNPLLPPLEESAVPDKIRQELNQALEAEAVRKANFKPLPSGATIPAPDSSPAKPKVEEKPGTKPSEPAKPKSAEKAAA
jgi:hypothetical protein